MSTITQSATSGKFSAEFLAGINPKSATKDDASMNVTEDRFLKLLTTQLRNQDPLNPMDNAEMTSQMAQISTVNGIEKLNASLQKLTSGSTDSQVMQAAAMLGREVLVEGDRMAVVSKDGAVRGGIAGFELKAPADDVKIKVFDVNGRQVATIPLGSAGIGIHDFQWSGQTDAGAAVADGTYRFKVEASRGSEKLSATLLQAGMVSGITRSSTGVGLQLANLAGDLDPVSVDAVRQIY